MDQFSDEASEDNARDGRTVIDCRQSDIQSVSTTTTTDTAASVCMETSFGVETDEPRTHVLNNARSRDRLSLQLVPGSLV